MTKRHSIDQALQAATNQRLWTRSVAFRPNTNGTPEAVKGNRAPNLSFRGYAAAFAGEQSYLEAQIRHTDLKRQFLDPNGVHLDTPEIAPEVQDLMRGVWRLPDNRVVRIIERGSGKQLIPGYQELSVLDEGERWHQDTVVRVPPECLDAVNDRPGRPRFYQNRPQYTFVQLIREARQGQPPVTTGAFFGRFFGQFKLENVAGKPVMVCGNVNIYKLDRVLTRQMIQTASAFYAEPISDQGDDFREVFCTHMEDLDGMLGELGLPEETIERLSLTRYGARRLLCKRGETSDDRKRERRYFLEMEKVWGATQRLLGLQLEDELFSERGDGLTDAFAFVETFETLLMQALGDELEQSKLNKLLKDSALMARRAHALTMREILNRTAFQAFLDMHYGVPIEDRGQWKEAMRRTLEKEYETDPSEGTLSDSSSDASASSDSQEPEEQPDDGISSPDDSATSSGEDDGDGSNELEPDTKPEAPQESTEKPAAPADKQARRTPRKKEEPKKKTPGSKGRQGAKKGLESLKDLDLNKSN